MKGCEDNLVTACKSILISFDMDATSRLAMKMTIGVYVEGEQKMWIKNGIIETFNGLSDQQQNDLQIVAAKWCSNNGLLSIINPDRIHRDRIIVNMAKSLPQHLRSKFMNDFHMVSLSTTFTEGINNLNNFYTTWKKCKYISSKMNIFKRVEYLERFFIFSAQIKPDRSYVIFIYIYIYIHYYIIIQSI